MIFFAVARNGAIVRFLLITQDVDELLRIFEGRIASLEQHMLCDFRFKHSDIIWQIRRLT